MFLGKHATPLDRNSRFTAPTHYTRDLERGAYILQGFERNLLVLPPEAFETLVRSMTAMNLADPLVRSLLRLMLGTARPVSLDKNSRLSLPGELKEFAQLEGDVILVGQGDFFEVWQPHLWEEQETLLRDALTNSSRFSTLNLTTR